MGIYEQHIAKQMHHIHLLWHAGLQEYKFEYLQKQFKVNSSALMSLPILQFIFIYSASNSGALLKLIDATY